MTSSAREDPMPDNCHGLTYNQRVVFAASLLRLPIGEARKHSGLIPGSSDIYLTSSSEYGGMSLVIGTDCSVLLADSSIGFDEHYERFKNGERTPFSYFE